MENEHISKNEVEGNYFVAKTMRIVSVFIILCFILDMLGVFKVSKFYMTVATIGGVIFSFLPTLVVNVLKIEKSWVKFFCVSCTIMTTAITIVTLNSNAVLMMLYPTAVCSIYLSNTINIYTLIGSGMFCCIAQIVSYVLDCSKDANITSMKGLINYLIVPRLFGQIAISIVIIVLTNRTSKILKSLLNAEKQQELYENLKKITQKAVNVSDQLSASMDTLAQTSENSAKKNEEIISITADVVNQSRDSLSKLEDADYTIKSIADSMNELSKTNQEVSNLSETVEKISKENSNTMEQSLKKMNDISTSNIDTLLKLRT